VQFDDDARGRQARDKNPLNPQGFPFFPQTWQGGGGRFDGADARRGQSAGEWKTLSIFIQLTARNIAFRPALPPSRVQLGPHFPLGFFQAAWRRAAHWCQLE